MRDDSKNKSTSSSTSPDRSLGWRVWQLIMVFGHFVRRQISLRNISVVTLLSLGGLSWWAYLFLAKPIPGADVIIDFPFVESLERQTTDGTIYTLYPRQAVFGCDVRADDAHSQRIFANHGAAMQYAREHGLPTIPSISAVLASCRVADARLQVALEHELERHADGRAALLQDWLSEVARRRALAAKGQWPIYDQALDYVAEAIRIGGGSARSPENLAIAPTPTLSACNDTPIGPWAANPEMNAIWRRDRYLSSALMITEGDDSAAVAAVLARSFMPDAQHVAGWERQAKVAAALAGTPSGLTFEFLATKLSDIADADLTGTHTRSRVLALFQPNSLPSVARLSVAPAYASWASSPEEAILYASNKAEDQPIVALISALRSGRVHLEPNATSGFYRRWWYALETLAVPERAPEKDKLQLKPSYAARWQRTFAAGFTDGRSGIVKRMPEVFLGVMGAGSGIPIQVAPTFTCEPAPVVYLRLARAYRNLNHDLETVFSSERWKAMVDAEGLSLSAALTERSTRLFGIAIQCYREIGYPALLSDEERTIDQKAATSLGRAWCDGSALDSDVIADARHLVTLIADDRGHHCPAIAGVRLEPVTYSWVEKPSIGGDFVPTLVPCHYWLTTPVFLTATLDKIPTPEEFRRDCDRYSTVAELSAAFHDTPMQPMREPSNWWQGYLVIGLTLLFIGFMSGGFRWWFHLIWQQRMMKANVVMLALIALPTWFVVFPPYWLVRMVAVNVLMAHENIALTWKYDFADWSTRRRDELFFDLIGDDNPQNRYWATWLCLSERDDYSQALPLNAERLAILDRALNDSVTEVNNAAWLKLVHSSLPTDQLLDLLKKHPAFAQSRLTLYFLANARPQDPAVISYAVRLATGNDPVQRVQSYVAIGQWRNPVAELTAVLGMGIKHDDPKIRRIAVEAFYKWVKIDDVPAIISCLTDVDRAVRVATLQTLHSMTEEVKKPTKKEPAYRISMANPPVQSALIEYVNLPTASFAERISASRWIYDPEKQRQLVFVLMAQAEALPPTTNSSYIQYNKGYAARWTKDHAAVHLIMQYLFAEQLAHWGRSSDYSEHNTFGLEKNPWLLKRLSDDIKQHADLATLVSTLGDGLIHADDVEIVIDLIGRVGPPAASLAQSLADLHDHSTDTRVRWWCASALAQLGPTAVALATSRLQDLMADVCYGSDAARVLMGLQQQNLL